MGSDSDFEARVVGQRWFQGSLIPWSGDLARDIQASGITGCDLLLDPGAPALPGRQPDGHFVLISQLCDLIRPAADEPFAVAIPAGPWDTDGSRPLPGRNSSRWYLMDEDARLVATLARPITFHKHLLPDRLAEPSSVQTMLFAAWCARRWRRPALPNPFVETVQRSLREALRKSRKHHGFLATACWRVEFLGVAPEGSGRARLVAIYRDDLIDPELFDQHVDQVLARMQDRLSKADEEYGAAHPEFVPYQLERTDRVSLNAYPLGAALDSALLVFDDLSPEPDHGDDDPYAEIAEEDLV